MGSVGYCKKGVRQALEPFGIHLQGSYAKDSAQQLASNPRVKEVSTNDLRPGDVLVHQPAGHGRTIGQRYAGHIAVYLGHGQEASDHVQHLIKGEGYGGTRAFRIVA
jgi:cell wall-associated NlpC family hydrolase